MSAFLEAARRLDKEATKGPWVWEANDDGYPTELVAEGVGVLRPAIAVIPRKGEVCAHISNDWDSAEVDHPDFALIAFTRSTLPEVAAVVEAGIRTLAYADRVRYCPTCRKDSFDLSPHHATCEFNALRTALAALDAKAKEVGS